MTKRFKTFLMNYVNKKIKIIEKIRNLQGGPNNTNGFLFKKQRNFIDEETKICQ